MNAYLIDGGDYQYAAFSVDGWVCHETERAIEVVFAEARGKARAIFLREFPRLEWTSPISIRLIAQDVDRIAGVADGKDEYWWEENWPFPDPYIVEQEEK